MNRIETSHQSSLFSDLENSIRLEESWKRALRAEFSKEYMKVLKAFLERERAAGKMIFPKASLFFAALDATPVERVKAVILGQDPYHGAGQAHGLSFSVPMGVQHPPSLVNIFKELKDDLGIEPPKSGDLTPWSRQGVLLLNSVLSVEEGRAASHQGRGWEQFTDAVIQTVNQKSEPVAFILWGSYAQKKAAFVDRRKHFVLQSPHPSPLSSYRGFFGSKPFTKVNEWLLAQNQTPINWSLT